MSMATGFRGVVGGSVQSTYTDQPGAGVAGMVAYASDNSLIDAIVVGEVDGISAGRGVKYTAATVGATAVGMQTPSVLAFLCASGDDVGDFAGVVVFDENMQTDENGVPGWAQGRVARIMRPGRSGGRFWAATRAAGVVSDKVYLVTDVGTQNVYKAGDFAAVSSSSDATFADLSTVAKWVTAPVSGGVAIIELL